MSEFLKSWSPGTNKCYGLPYDVNRKHLLEGHDFHEYNVFQYKDITTQVFTASHLGYVLAIFIRIRDYVIILL